MHPECHMYVICTHLFSKINQYNVTQTVSIGEVKSLLNICGSVFLGVDDFSPNFYFNVLSSFWSFVESLKFESIWNWASFDLK